MSRGKVYSARSLDSISARTIFAFNNLASPIEDVGEPDKRPPGYVT